MTELHTLQCVPCRKGAPPATAEEIAQLRPQIPAWDIVDADGVPRLRRTFQFPNFAEALEFTRQVGELAEAQGHHPVLLTRWGRVTVDWTTNKIRNLHRNDFVMAARTDELYAGRRASD